VVLLAVFVWSVRPNITKMPMMTARAKAPLIIQLGCEVGSGIEDCDLNRFDRSRAPPSVKLESNARAVQCSPTVTSRGLAAPASNSSGPAAPLLAPMTKADTQLQRLLAEGAGCAFHQFGYFCNWGLCFRMPTQLCVQRFSPTFALIALCFLRHAPPLVYDKVLTSEKPAKCN
jgi:hypothetical protein